MAIEVKTLVLVAMPKEEKAVLESLTKLGHSAKVIDSDPVSCYYVADRALAVARVGVGPIAAAFNLSQLLSRLSSTKRLVLLGVAGALRPDLRPGDVVAATGVVQHDAVYSSDSEQGLMLAGELYLSLPPDKRPSPLVRTDAALTSQLAAVATSGRRAAVPGILLSGSSFCGTHSGKAALAEIWPGASVVDMESAAVSFVARSLGLGFAVIKTVADRFDPAVRAEDDYLRFLESACRNAAEVVCAL